MSNTEIVMWQNNNQPIQLKKVSKIEDLVSRGLQLNLKDKKQIVSAFNNGSFEMVSTYTWTKTITSLKTQLSKMGISFIAEMLDRPDINEYTDVQQAITEFEAIRLAEELGVISGTSAFRLKKARETVAHFNQIELDDFEEEEMTEDEARTIVRTCIQAILGYSRIDAAIDFKNFRTDLEEQTLSDDSQHILKLTQSPYFFHRTVIRILLSLVKTTNGAQLENALANSNLIIPKLWSNLQQPEKWQIGRTYSELYMDGQTIAASGLKRLLLKVKGFDYVPEDLRSSSFIKVANEILAAHEGMNNFYNEPKHVSALYSMGNVIPAPAFPICITAILCVKLGNSYGVSRAAQSTANNIIKNVSDDRWVYFFKECLQYNDRLLYKLMDSTMSKKWLDLFSKYVTIINNAIDEIQDRNLINLLKYTIENNSTKLKKLASKMYQKIGYSNIA